MDHLGQDLRSLQVTDLLVRGCWGSRGLSRQESTPGPLVQAASQTPGAIVEPSGSSCFRGGGGFPTTEVRWFLRDGFLPWKTPLSMGHFCSHVLCVPAVSFPPSFLATGRQSRPSTEEPAQPHCTGRCPSLATWALPSSHCDYDSPCPLFPWALSIPTSILGTPKAERSLATPSVSHGLVPEPGSVPGLPFPVVFPICGPIKCITHLPSYCPGEYLLAAKG